MFDFILAVIISLVYGSCRNFGAPRKWGRFPLATKQVHVSTSITLIYFKIINRNKSTMDYYDSDGDYDAFGHMTAQMDMVVLAMTHHTFQRTTRN